MRAGGKLSLSKCLSKKKKCLQLHLHFVFPFLSLHWLRSLAANPCTYTFRLLFLSFSHFSLLLPFLMYSRVLFLSHFVHSPLISCFICVRKGLVLESTRKMETRGEASHATTLGGSCGWHRKRELKQQRRKWHGRK